MLPDPWPTTLEKLFTMKSQRADEHEDQPTIRRCYLSQAAVYADLLAQHYHKAKDSKKEKLWDDRATRYSRRAFRPSRSILKNIGAVMP